MKWNDIELDTIGKVCDALKTVQTQKDADSFMAGMRAEGKHADDNVGYIIGYLSREDQDRLYPLLGVTHPVLGSKPSDLSTEEIFRRGREWGERIVGKSS